mmetsp:Transcript_15107/g.33311  ORF Transcript_15107/g.33311 Transcript_15107/m.33311 type:complete len:259 (+) Transcript_15107:284-1060(+)
MAPATKAPTAVRIRHSCTTIASLPVRGKDDAQVKRPADLSARVGGIVRISTEAPPTPAVCRDGACECGRTGRTCKASVRPPWLRVGAGKGGISAMRAGTSVTSPATSTWDAVWATAASASATASPAAASAWDAASPAAAPASATASEAASSALDAAVPTAAAACNTASAAAASTWDPASPTAVSTWSGAAATALASAAAVAPAAATSAGIAALLCCASRANEPTPEYPPTTLLPPTSAPAAYLLVAVCCEALDPGSLP